MFPISVFKPNQTLNTIFTNSRDRVFAILNIIDTQLCAKGITSKIEDITVWNSVFIYLSLIYTDINSNISIPKDEEYYKCKYNWTCHVEGFKCKGIDIQDMANSINLFTKNTTSINILCSLAII